jgi:transposase
VENVITYVGLDVHKKMIMVAMLVPGQRVPLRWECPNEREKVLRTLKRIRREAVGPVQMCYEAGPCGYALQRQVAEFDGSMKCVVVAPSLIPRKPGERIKTDKRDALKLAEYLRSGLLTEVHPPTSEEEAVRDLCRAREDASEDLRRSQHRLSKFLLRRDVAFTRGKKAWTRSHRLWLNGLKFDDACTQSVFDDYWRTHELGQSAAHRHHQNRKRTRAPTLDRVRLALPASRCPRRRTQEAQAGTIHAGHCHRRQGHAAPQPALHPHAGEG